jgi:hypothetical protein
MLDQLENCVPFHLSVALLSRARTVGIRCDGPLSGYYAVPYMLGYCVFVRFRCVHSSADMIINEHTVPFHEGIVDSYLL